MLDSIKLDGPTMKVWLDLRGRDRFVVLVGRNGVGKSVVLAAIEHCNYLTFSGLNNANWPREFNMRHSFTDPVSIDAQGMLEKTIRALGDVPRYQACSTKVYAVANPGFRAVEMKSLHPSAARNYAEVEDKRFSWSPGQRVVLMENIGEGLHPQEASMQEVQRLRAAVLKDPELQLIGTTYSPYVADELPEGSVFVLDRDSEGVTRGQWLDQHPEYSRWKGVLSTGEAWSSHGEEWVHASPAVEG